MYNYLSIATCIIFIIISYKRKRLICNPLLILGVLWLFILGLESLHLYNINIPSDNVYKMIFYGLCSFGIGYWISYIFKKNYRLSINSKRKINFKKYNIDYIPRYKLLCLLGILCILYYLKNISYAMMLLINGKGLDSIRLMVQNPESIVNVRSNIENAIRILIVIPSSLAIEAIAAIDFWFGKRHRGLLTISIIIIILRVITEGGRTPIVNFLIYMIIGFIFLIFKNKNYKINIFKKKIKKRYILLIIIIGSGFLYYTTISRNGNNSLKTIYYYFSMQPYMLDNWSQVAKTNNLIGYGVAAFNGFIFPILYIFKNFFGIPFPEWWVDIYNMILKTDSHWISITTTGIRANAYVSMFWFFYVDGRILGVIVGMFLYGVIVANYFVNSIKFINSKNVCIYALIVQGLIFSFIRFSFSNLYYSLAFIFIIFIAYKKVIIKS